MAVRPRVASIEELGDMGALVVGTSTCTGIGWVGTGYF